MDKCTCISSCPNFIIFFLGLLWESGLSIFGQQEAYIQTSPKSPNLVPSQACLAAWPTKQTQARTQMQVTSVKARAQPRNLQLHKIEKAWAPPQPAWPELRQQSSNDQLACLEGYFCQNTAFNNHKKTNLRGIWFIWYLSCLYKQRHLSFYFFLVKSLTL